MKKEERRKLIHLSGKLLEELIRRSRKTDFGVDVSGYVKSILWKKMRLK